MQPVDQRVGAFEPAGAHHVGARDFGDDVFGVEGAGPAGDLGVAEAVKGVVGGPLLDTLTGEGVGVGGFRDPQRTHPELAVLEHFGVPQRDGGAFWALHCDAEASDQVLAEVEQQLAGRRGAHLLHRHGLGDPYHRGGARAGYRAGRHDRGRRPVAGEAGL